MTRTLITGGKIVDGAGNPWFMGDLLIEGETIAAIAPAESIDQATVDEVVDAAGHVVSPGFIDIQSHSIVPFLTDRRAISKVSQGGTTEIMGGGWTPSPFGGRVETPITPGLKRRIGDSYDEWVERAKGWTRFGDWLADLESRGVSVNVGSFLGSGTLREFGRGQEMGPSSPDEMETMRRVMAEAMEDGAFGISYALIYPPESYADTDELVEMLEDCDIYLTPYPNLQQATSGTLSYAVALGRAVISPPYIHARELLADTGGVLDGDLDQFMAAALAQKAFGGVPGQVEDVL